VGEVDQKNAPTTAPGRDRLRCPRRSHYLTHLPWFGVYVSAQ
jgi:hypothetical protein